MKVTITVEVDMLDADGHVVGTAQTTSTLEDDHRIDAADVVAAYDADRHNTMIRLNEKGLHPAWDYPKMYGTPSKPSPDPKPSSAPTSPTSMT